MQRRVWWSAVLVVGVAVSGADDVRAQAPERPGIEALQEQLRQLRAELEAVRAECAARAAALETRLDDAAEHTPAPAAPEAPAEAPVPAGAAGAGGPSGSLPLYGSPSLASKVFNPDIAVIGDFSGRAGPDQDDAAEPLELREVEVSLQAVVDPYARADFFVAFGPHEVEIEEAYVTFPTLPGGLLAKLGKLKARFGVVNTLHNHVHASIDRPLILEGLLGGEEGLADAGVSVSRLIPNPWLFLEATGEVYRGESGLFTRERRTDLTYVGRLRGYGDLTESANLDVGASLATGTNFAGGGARTDLFGVDATFRYRPLRRAIYRRLLARTELVWRRTELGDGARAEAFGGYFGAEYQIARRYFAGLRLDYAERATDPGSTDKAASALLTFWPSEFSQVRGQYRRTWRGDGSANDELLFQFVFAIGAHGAHPF